MDAVIVLALIALVYAFSLGSDAIGIPVLGFVIRLFCILFAVYVVILFIRRMFVVGRFSIVGGDTGQLAIDFLSISLTLTRGADQEDWPTPLELNERARMARNLGPHDPITIGAWSVVKFWSFALLILMPLRMIMTAAGGCLWALTFGVLGLLLQVMWAIFELPLLGSSRLWLAWWPTRPILFLPGLAVALAAALFVTLTPEPNERYRYLKLTLVDEWPYSWYVISPKA